MTDTEASELVGRLRVHSHRADSPIANEAADRITQLEQVARRARKWLPHVEGCQVGGEVDLLCDDIDALLEPRT